MRVHISMLLLAVVFFVGCDTQTGVAPTETVIAKSSDRDFEFEGTWTPIPNDDFPGNDTAGMTIKRDGDYTVDLHAWADLHGDEFTVGFRTHEISKDHLHAIVEIELTNDGQVEYHRLAIAAVQDDQLNLWMIDGKKIGEHLYNDDVSAVIEHLAFSSTIRCDSEKLLESLAKHSGEIVGPVQSFKRKPKDGNESPADESRDAQQNETVESALAKISTGTLQSELVELMKPHSLDSGTVYWGGTGKCRMYFQIADDKQVWFELSGPTNGDSVTQVGAVEKKTKWTRHDGDSISVDEQAD